MRRTTSPHQGWVVPALVFTGVGGIATLVYALTRQKSPAGLWELGPALDPSQNIVISGWGDERDYRGTPSNPHPIHQGLDLAAHEGSNVYAQADGLVHIVAHEPYEIRGNWIDIEHASGLHAEYVHLQKILVKAGQKVRRGQLVALSGHTGRRPDGTGYPSHLHITTRIAKQWLQAYVRRYGVPSTGFGTNAWGGVAVPAEPLVPAVYRPSVVANAGRRGIPVVRQIAA